LRHALHAQTQDLIGLRGAAQTQATKEDEQLEEEGVSEQACRSSP
jgi:hypothetical protein